MDKRSPLYEYCLLIALQEVEVTVKPVLRKRTVGVANSSPAAAGPVTRKGYQPYVERFHPKPPSVGSIPVFCFPDANSLTEESVQNKKHVAHHAHFCVMLTEQDGQKHFCFCLRTLTAPDGMPRSLCVVTQRGWFHFFPQLLRRLETVYAQSGFDRVCEVLNQGIDSQQLLLVGSCQFPALVELTDSAALATPDKKPFQGPDAATLADGHPLADVSPLPLFKRLFVSHVLVLFAALLNERRVLCFSNSYTRLSDCLFAALAAIRPFAWQHMFIPVLPERLLDYVAAPFPFLIGVHSGLRSRVQQLPLDDVLLVDLDKNYVELGADNDLKTLPKKHVQMLRNSLDRAVRAARSTRSLKRQALQAPFELFFADILRNFHRFFRAPSAGPLARDAAAASVTGGTNGGNGGDSAVSVPASSQALSSVASGPTATNGATQLDQKLQAQLRWTYDLRAFLRSQSSRARRAFLRLMCQSQLWEQFVAERLDLLAAAGPALAHPSLLASHSAWDAALLARDALETGATLSTTSAPPLLTGSTGFFGGAGGNNNKNNAGLSTSSGAAASASSLFDVTAASGTGAAFVASASAVMADAGHRLLRSWQRLAEKNADKPTGHSVVADESRTVDRLKAGMARAAKTLRSGTASTGIQQLHQSTAPSPRLTNSRFRKNAPAPEPLPVFRSSGRSFFDEIKADFSGSGSANTAIAAAKEETENSDQLSSSLSDNESVVDSDDDDDRHHMVPLEDQADEKEETLSRPGTSVFISTENVDDDDDDEILSAETKALEEAADQAASLAAQQHRLRRQRERQQQWETWSPPSGKRRPHGPDVRRASTAYNAMLTVANDTGKELDFLSSPGSVLTSRPSPAVPALNGAEQPQQSQQLDLLGLADFSVSSPGSGRGQASDAQTVDDEDDAPIELLQALQPFARKRQPSRGGGSDWSGNPFSPSFVGVSPALSAAANTVDSGLPFDDNFFSSPSSPQAGTSSTDGVAVAATATDIESLFSQAAVSPPPESKLTLLDLM